MPLATRRRAPTSERYNPSRRVQTRVCHGSCKEATLRIQLRLTLDTAADQLWDALHNPSVFTRVSGPLLAMHSLEPGGLPERWTGDGPHRISIRALDLIPLGEQTIDITDETRPDGTRIMTDAGRPLSGSLAMITSWRHRMAVTEQPNGRTLYRDRLDVSAGILTPLIWISLWAFWQWRALRLRAVLRREER